MGARLEIEGSYGTRSTQYIADGQGYHTTLADGTRIMVNCEFPNPYQYNPHTPTPAEQQIIQALTAIGCALREKEESDLAEYHRLQAEMWKEAYEKLLEKMKCIVPSAE